MNVGGAFGITLLEVFLIILSFVEWSIIIFVVLSWVIFFTAQTSFRFRHRTLFHILFELNELFTRFANPLLKPFRRLLPPYRTGGLDLSPLLLLLVIFFIRRFVLRLIAPLY